MDHAGSNITAADEPPALPFKEAIAAIKSRASLTKAEWNALEPQLRFRAFTVARLSSADAIERVRKATVAALQEGKPFAEFWTEASAAEVAGISASSPWYWETVFRTNVQTAYNTGRAAEFARSKPEYLEFVGIEDDRQTTICEERSGVVRPADDPWWQKNWPPLHFGCRSVPRGIWKEEAELLHVQPSSDRRVRRLPAPAGDFGGNPLSTGSFWKLTPSMLQRAEAYGIGGELRSFAQSLGLEYDPSQVSALRNEVHLVESSKAVVASQEERKTISASLAELRKAPLNNAQLKEGVVITKAGLKHAISFSGNPVKLSALRDLPDIIEKAKIVSSEPYRGSSPDFSDLLRARVAYTVGEQSVQLELILLKRKADGLLVFYDLIPHTAQ